MTGDRLSRRALLGSGAALAAGACAGRLAGTDPRPADVRLRIAPHRVELAPGVEFSTLAYNDRVPGPVIRLPAGREALFEIENATPVPELVHWHGLEIPSSVDGAAEEGTPEVAPFATRRYRFAPTPHGTQWYHTHTMGAKNLALGAYTGLFGMFVIEPRDDPARYDLEVPVAMHHWGPRWVPGRTLRPKDPEHGLEVAYRHGTMNGRLYGHADPIRVRQGQRVLFRLLNASATENTWTCLAGHKLAVVAMDGHPVPRQAEIDVLLLGPGERADVIVTMDNPGVWVLGPAIEAELESGMGLVVEYAGHGGEPVWRGPKRGWSYQPFSHGGDCPEPDVRIPLTIGRIAGGPEGHNQWTFNGKTWPDVPHIRVERGKRHRLVFTNETDHGHPMHLHRHSFEIARYEGYACPGLFKDTLNVKPHQTVELDFVADNPGPTLLHCHQAKHQDFGLMALLLYDGDEAPHVDHAAMLAAARRAVCAGTPAG